MLGSPERGDQQETNLVDWDPQRLNAMPRPIFFEKCGG